MSHHRKEEEFDKLLAESVSSTLSEVLGDTAAEALKFHLGPPRVPLDSGELSGKLEKVLGGGSVVIELLIAKNLSLTLGGRVNEAGRFRFAEFIETMRKEYRG